MPTSARSRSLRTLGAIAAAVAVLAPASTATAAEVTAQKRCYAEGDDIDVAGTGFTANGQVRLTLERDGRALVDTSEPRADAQGALRGNYGVRNETGWFTGSETRFDMTLRLTDVTNASITASTAFIFSRWNVGIRARGGRIHPRRSFRMTAIGYTNGIGKSLYAHWVRKGRVRKTMRMGTLRGPCGDATRTVRRGFPFRPVAAGTWRVTFNTSRTDARARDSIVHRAARVTRTIR